MRSDKAHAFALRRAGKSYKEITIELHVAKSTLSNWFSGMDFSEEIKRSLIPRVTELSIKRLQALNAARGDVLRALYKRAEIEAIEMIRVEQDNPLFVAGVMAYWGEGDKMTKNQVRITNTDATFLKIYLEFLTKVCKVEMERIRLALFIYADLNDAKCMKYWSDQLGVSSFHKTMILPSRDKKHKLPYGTCTIVVSNSYLKKQIMVWIDHLPEIILNRGRTQ